MAITSNSYTGNGSTTLYSFTFPYLDESHVKVTLAGTLTTAYTFANATTIQFNTAPGAGVAIRIYRETNNDQTEATFFAGSSIKAQDLNNNFTQTLYTVQEVVDRYLSKVGDTMQGILNMGGYRITNLGAPTTSSDATTKAYVDGIALAGTVPDGDRGDITVSGTGTIWTIDNNTITSSKIADGTIVDADVNASAGIVASKLSFTQTGAGAVARTVDSKLKEKAVSVKDFGAVGDGITNDTTSFAAAFAYLNSGSEPRALFIPSGNYLVNHSTCLITSSHRSLFGEGPTSRLITASIVNGAFGIKVEGISDTNHISDVLISDLAVVASGWTGDNGTNGIAINRADRCSVQRCTVLGDSSGQSWEQGIIFRDTNNGLIANNIVRRIRGNGISLDLLLGSEDTIGNLVVGNTISIVGDSGVGFHNNVRYSAAIGNVIDRPGQGAGTGIDIAGCNLCLFEGNVVSNSGQYGIRLLQNLSYRTVDNVVTGNTVYHPSTAGVFAAVQVSNTERNMITNNKIIGNSSGLTSRGIYVDYASTGTATHPVTSEALYKLRGTVIANNTIERFAGGMVLDAAGGITGATLIVDKNLFLACTTGISFNTGASEKRFTLYGQNSYFDCTANVSSLTGGIVQDGDPLLETLAIIPCNVSTLGTETTVSTALLTRVPNANQQLIGYHRVSEVGAFDGQINYKSSAGTTLVSDVFGSVTNAIRSAVIPLTSNDLLTVSIQKTGSPPTGTVDCNGLSFTLATYY